MDIGRLIDISPRTAWANEVASFTPWLAANLDRLSEAIGVPLELEGREVAVESFSADILARNLADDSLILIENQLETTDHTHLGQILTYLAGLDAKTVIWIARDFRAPHLPAIKWLNQHTVDPFAFFAVRLRLVQIGDSLPAPIFDVLERPNAWERRLQSIAVAHENVSGISQFRRDYWQAYRERYPEDAAYNVPSAGSNWWWALEAFGLTISIYIGVAEIGLFVRGPLGEAREETHRKLEPYSGLLEDRLGVPLVEPGKEYYFLMSRKINMRDRSNWSDSISWMHDKAHLYANTLTTTINLGK